MPGTPATGRLSFWSGALRRLGRFLARRCLVVVAVGVAVATAALGAALSQRPRYHATATVGIAQAATDLLDPAAAAADNVPAARLRTGGNVVTSAPVRQAVAAQLGSAPPVTVTTHHGGQVIDIGADDRDRARAASVATAYATAFATYVTDQAQAAGVVAEAQVQAQLARLGSQLGELNNQIQAAPPPDQAQEAASLGPQMAELTREQTAFQQQLAQLRRQAEGASHNPPSVTPAPLPGAPTSPRPVRDALAGLLAGLLVGLIAAAAVEYLDDTVRAAEEIDPLLGGRPILGILPASPGLPPEAAGIRPTGAPGPTSPAYRALAATIAARKDLRTVLVTSPSPGEGKTTVVADLGVALARAGQRVVVVDCSFERPRLSSWFGPATGDGFTSVLTGAVPIFQALRPVPGVPGLSVLACGPALGPPRETLATERASELLAAVSRQADIVLVDSAPLSGGQATATLAHRLVDATVVVARIGTTRRRPLARALERLDQLDGHPLGVVVNQVALPAPGLTGEPTFPEGPGAPTTGRERVLPVA